MLYFEFGGLELTGIVVAHDISFDLGRNYFETGDRMKGLDVRVPCAIPLFWK